MGRRFKSIFLVSKFEERTEALGGSLQGHTDAKGNCEYNLKLSQQRADAIREALINPFGISPSRIDAAGLGEAQLLKPVDPEAAENRRVQLINVGRGL